MKILVITDLYPVSENENYTPKTIKAFVDCWQKSGHEVNVIKPNFVLNSFLRRKRFYRGGFYGNVENVNYWLPFLGNLREKIKTSLEADIVIAHMPSGIIAANKLGLNFCAAVHVSDLEVLTNPIYKIYFKTELEKAYKNALKIACRSYVLKDKFLKLYPEYEFKTFVAASGVNADVIKKEWEAKNKVKVLTCGQFIKRKNIDKVILACEELENVELTVIGSGTEDASLKKLSKKPTFKGQISHSKVLETMRKSDIFILPSVNETFGMVYLEAMASGCIVVCTKGDGVDGIIRDGENGFLTGANVEEIKNTILKIINLNDKNKIMDNAYKTILDYTQENQSVNYLNNILSEIK